MKTKERI